MSPLRFRCVPAEWVHAPELSRVSVLANLTFIHIALLSDRHWRFSDEARLVRNLSHPNRPDLRLPDVARCLSELLGSGALVRGTASGKTWVSVAVHLRYEKGREAGWGHGPDEDPPDAQQVLRLGPVEMCGMPPQLAIADIPARERVEREVENDYSGTRATSRGEDSRRSAPMSGEDDFMRRLAITAGPVEALSNGGIWLERYRAHPREMLEALGDMHNQLASGKKAKTTKGAWLTYLWELGTGRKTA